MKPKKFSEHGQALILITAAAIGLFAIVGLAIDGGRKSSDRRHAQNAADTAALAGALSLADSGIKTPENALSDPNWRLAALNRAQTNGYSNSLVNSTVEVYLCSEDEADCGSYSSHADAYRYIQVIIDSYVDTTFARVIGVYQLHNRVEAVTLWAPTGPTYGPELLKSLNPNPCTGSNGNIVFGGNGDVVLDGGGAYINSGGDDCGMEFTGCGNLQVIDGDLTSVGSGNINIGTPSDGCMENLIVPEPSYGYAPGFEFPPDMPEKPAECSWADYGTWTNEVDGVSYLEPGRYAEFPPENKPSSPIYDKIVMKPGIYCVESMVKLQDKNLDLTGHDVLIYILNGGQFDVQGGHIHLEGRYPDSSYAGYLIIINTDFTGTVPNCTINGNSSNVYVGTIFAPYCDFIFNGTNETGDPALNYAVQVVAYTITLNGNSDINFFYDPEDVAKSDPKVGLMQ